MSEVRCPHCQTVLPEKASFCAACGNRIEGWSSVPAAPQPTILPGGDEPTTSTQPTPSLLRAAALSKKKPPPRRNAGWIYVGVAAVAAGATYYLASRPAPHPAAPPAPVAVAPVAPVAAAPSPPAAVSAVAAPAHAKKGAHHPHRIDPVPMPPTRPAMVIPKGVKGSGALPHKSVSTDSKAMTQPVLETVSAPAQPPPSDEEMKKEAEASLDADSIRFVVKSHLSQVHACYERAFKDSSPGGRVEIGFAITPDGSPARVRTEANTTGSDSLANCLEGRVRSWQFPRPVGGDYELIYPFVFAAGS
jgi:hypothetical protein